MQASITLQSYTEAFLRLFFPEHCGACQGFLNLDEQILCHSCEGKLNGLQYSVDEMLSDESPAGLDHVWSLYRYEEPLKSILTAVKFSGKRRLLKIFRPSLNESAGLFQAETDYEAIIPIPLDRKRFLEREYNQSELIAAMIAKSDWTRLETGLLKKPHASPAQSRLHRTERLANLYGAFEVRGSKKLTGKSFLLVDDILTTGATAQEAARVLKSRGAKRVDMITLARTERKQ